MRRTYVHKADPVLVVDIVRDEHKRHAWDDLEEVVHVLDFHDLEVRVRLREIRRAREALRRNEFLLLARHSGRIALGTGYVADTAKERRSGMRLEGDRGKRGVAERRHAPGRVVLGEVRGRRRCHLRSAGRSGAARREGATGTEH